MADVELDDLFADADARVGTGPVPLEVRDVVLDPVFGKRRDALLRTVPVHDLVDRAARSDSGLARFDVRALVLAAFDAVIARQGFPERTTPEQVLTLLAGIAAVQDPQAGPAGCRQVAEHVLDGLTNRRLRERQFTLSSVAYAEGERGEVVATEVRRAFWLLREAEDRATGDTYLEASPDAINALVGGLDIPIEDQQTAMETVLERQLARGELDAAHATALQARRLTAAYLTQVEELLAETERYLPGTDWAQAAPALVNDALDHLSECLIREGRLLEHVAGGVNDRGAASAEKRAKVSAALTKLLGESRQLHTSLMDRLIGARGRFLDAQDSQMFRPVLTSVEFDLADDLLIPTLGLRTGDAETVAGAYLRACLGPVPPVVLNWGDFVETLLHAPEHRQDEPAEPDETELTFRADPEPLVTRALLTATHTVLARVPLPTRLSTLLAACPTGNAGGAAVFDLLVAAALRGFDNAARDSTPGHHPGDWADDDAEPQGHQPGEHAGSPDGSPKPVHLLDVLGGDATCFSDGARLVGHGWSGDDLVVCVDRDQADAIHLGDQPTPPPTPVPDRLRRET